MNEKGTDSLNGAVEDLLWRFGQVEFDERSWVLRIDGVEQSLEPRPLEILAYLLRHAGEVVTKEELLDVVWGRSTETISDKVLTNAVGKLRRALGDEEEAMIATVHRRGYRLVAPVSRVVLTGRAVPKLDFKPGDVVPRREQWRLVRALDISSRSEVWLAEHAKTKEHRVYKFSPDGAQLSSLKREATLSRVLRESLGERSDFVRVLEWNFEEAPYFLECEYGGEDAVRWAASQGGLEAIPMSLRLAMFVQAAEAIAAAHGVGVLHKDIKPANLLLTPTKDGGWQLRVTDFGSGRLMHPQRLRELGITQLGFTQTQAITSDSLTGSPLYLAPELLSGNTPSQAADVYALGVLLYQLVSGDFRRPLAAGWELHVADELLREDIAAAAAGDPGLRLESARVIAQRVSSLEERRLARTRERTVRRELESARARLQQARVRRPWVIAAAITMVVGFAVSLGLLWQVSVSRSEATHQLMVAEAVNDFLQNGLLARANPYKAGRADLSVGEALDAAATEVDVRFRDQPELAATTHRSLGLAYRALTQDQKSLLHFEQALALYGSAGPSPSEEVQRTRLDVALEYGRLSRFDDMRRQIDVVRNSLRSPSSLLASGLEYTEGSFYSLKLDFKPAVDHYRKALVFAEADSGFPADQIESIRYELARSLIRCGEVAAGKALQEQLLAESTQRRGKDHPETLGHRLSLASTLSILEQYQEALRLLQEALPDAERVFGPNHDRTLDFLNNMAVASGGLNDHEGAVAIGEEKLRRLTEKLGAGPPNRTLLITVMDLGNQLVHAGRSAEAIPRLRQALDIARTLYNENHAFYHIVATTLAIAYLDVGDAPAARPLLDHVDADVVIAATRWQEYHGRLALHRGREREISGDPKGARVQYQYAVDEFAKTLPADSPERQRAISGLVRVSPGTGS